MNLKSPLWPNGFAYYPGYFDRQAQQGLIKAVGDAVRGGTPFYRPTMPRTGHPLSVVMSNFGSLGWVTDQKKGYRYEPHHPKTRNPWLPIPQTLLDLWDTLTDCPAHPEACLINWYTENSKIGLHIDNDEQAVSAPIVSVSLGDCARFRLGGPTRRGKTQNFKLSSGDVVVMAGPARHCYHGVDKIFPGTSSLVPKGGRINLTMRRIYRV